MLLWNNSIPIPRWWNIAPCLYDELCGAVLADCGKCCSGCCALLPGRRWCHELVCIMCASRPAVLLSQIRPQPSCNVSEIEIEIESEISEDEEAQNSIRNKMLELSTLQGSCPMLQYQSEDWEICRVASSCHFELDIIYAFTAKDGRFYEGDASGEDAGLLLPS